MCAFQKGWYLLYTKPRHEKKVHSQLADLEIASLLPLRKKVTLQGERRRFSMEPLFPSYVFIYLNDLKNYYSGMGIEGVLSYVRFGKQIARVSDPVVNNIRLLSENDIEMEASTKEFEKGKGLYISKGPLTGLTCEVIQVGTKNKILVRVQMLKRNILASFSRDFFLDLENQ